MLVTWYCLTKADRRASVSSSKTAVAVVGRVGMQASWKGWVDPMVGHHGDVTVFDGLKGLGAGVQSEIGGRAVNAAEVVLVGGTFGKRKVP